ncbi:MAG: putative sulfate exporter family transporter, partial [Desulfocucumaceae bacterium]
MLMAATTTKIFIDIFIGVWAFILAVIWCVYPIDKRARAEAATCNVPTRVSPIEIWDRFPKFVIGFVITLLTMFFIGLANPGIVKQAKLGADHANALRSLFFAL